MAHEGFIFAKLPRCFDFPQLNYWIMYRRGIFLSDQDKGTETQFLKFNNKEKLIIL